MEHTINRSIVREVALDGGICLLVLAALPILALLGIAVRGAVLAAILIGALLCALLYPVSARFREWFKTEAEIEYCHRGIRLARDVFLHPAHSWARWEKDAVTVGADDLLLCAVGPVEHVELPARGKRIDRGSPLFDVRRGERSVRVLSPVSGRILETNEVLRLYPELMNELPFGQGWVVRLEPQDADQQRKSLMPAGRARAWFRREVDRAADAVAMGDQVHGPALYRYLDRAGWNRLSTMFTARAGEPTEG